MKRYGEHRFPGKLFVVEGIDGSGKSTQLLLLHQWLRAEGYGVVFSEWNSSLVVKDTTKRGKKKKLLTPSTFCLIHATDFADRMERNIIPLLKAGAVVLCDRYIYTAFARDVARGMDPKWTRELYSFAVKPTLAFYFRVPLEIAMKRLNDSRNGFKFYEAGMDLELRDRKSTRLNSSHGYISYAVFCLKKKKEIWTTALIIQGATLIHSTTRS